MPVLRPSAEVADALHRGLPVVALESTILTHGLPRPDNLDVARRVEAAVRSAGAVPATVAVVAGEVRVGLDDADLAAVASRDDVAKAGARDLAVVAAQGGWAGTTVSATATVAARAGIALFATGGIGGVHRGARETWDESADLTALSRLPTAVVCAGVKSILDVAATLERLETLGVAVLGYRTWGFPGFYLTDSGHPVPARVDSAAEAAAVLRARAALGTDTAGLLLANPLPPEQQLDPALHDAVLDEALAAAAAAGASGKDVTPFLLDRFHRATGGASLEANVRLVLANARLAAEVARELAADPPPEGR